MESSFRFFTSLVFSAEGLLQARAATRVSDLNGNYHTRLPLPISA